jgi:hypothetical protein
LSFLTVDIVCKKYQQIKAKEQNETL